jgi:uncharacterized membrane protein
MGKAGRKESAGTQRTDAQRRVAMLNALKLLIIPIAYVALIFAFVAAGQSITEAIILTLAFICGFAVFAIFACVIISVMQE